MSIIDKVFSPFKSRKLIEEPVYIPEKPKRRFAVLGDFHIPGRAKKIPEEFIKIIKQGKFEKILCTGDLTNDETYNQISALGEVICVAGNMDAAGKYAVEKRLVIGDYKIGITHARGVYPRGDPDQLLEIADNMDVNILITGHTHTLDVRKYNNKIFLNPGSATGVYSGGSASLIPTFIALELNDSVKVKTYRLLNGIVESREETLELPRKHQSEF